MGITGVSALSAACLTFGLLLALTRRKWTSLSVTLYLMAAILLSSWIKQSYQGMAMTLGDVHFFLLHPVENFKLLVRYPQFGATLLALCGAAAALLIAGVRRERPAKRARIAILAIGIGALGSMARPTSADVKLHGDAYATWLSMSEILNPTGWVSRLDVFFENWDSTATLPALRLQTRFKQQAANRQAGAPRDRFPDILMVFEESTFDPTLIARCHYPECDSPMLHALPFAESEQEGPLLTHTTGGGSWLTEFAFLAGFDWRVFGRGGRLAPLSLAPRVRISLPRKLRALGYRTVAIYPSDGDFLGAKTAYSHYGFDEFHDARELKLPGGWFETRDSMVFEKALAAADRPEDPRPVFLLVLTIRNHGPYRNSEQSLAEEFKPIGREMGFEFADYLSRMQDSSKDYVELAERWLRSPRPRVIGWFGDHEPEPAWKFLASLADLNPSRHDPGTTAAQLLYLTRYQLSSNRAAGTAGVSGRALSGLDVSYLGDELLAFAGLPLDDGASAAVSVAAECKGLMLDCPDRELIKDYLSYRVHDLKSID